MASFLSDPLLLNGWFLAIMLMLVLWVIQLAKRDAGVVDFGWCSGIGMLAVYYALAADGWAPRRYLVGALAGLWSARISTHLLIDRIIGKEEDFRYGTLRRRLGAWAQVSFLVYFLFTSLLISLFSVPLLVLANHTRPSFGPWEIAGVLLGITAILGESASDRQLVRFRAKPENRGRTCREGLWAYSRHPNYFSEWLYWWSYTLMAVGAPHAWLTLVGPLGILVPLFMLTGIPATEAQALATLGEDYRAYQRSTSMFIPWFPRREQ